MFFPVFQWRCGNVMKKAFLNNLSSQCQLDNFGSMSLSYIMVKQLQMRQNAEK